MLEASQPILTQITASPGLQANAAVVSALCEVGALSAAVIFRQRAASDQQQQHGDE